MPSFRELLAETKSQIREVDTATADERRSRPGAVVLDVREPDEYEQGAIPGAGHDELRAALLADVSLAYLVSHSLVSLPERFSAQF